VVVMQYRGESVCVVINVSDDSITLPEYEGKLDMITQTLFYGNVAPYGVYFSGGRCRLFELFLV